MHDMIPLACPILFHLKLMWDDKGAEVGQNTKVCVLGVIFLYAPSSDVDEIVFIRQPYVSAKPLCKNNIGVQPY